MTAEPCRPETQPVVFYMVWTKTGWPPRKQHHTRQEAEKEADRLARRHPGKKFIVLQAVAKVAVPVPEVAA